MISGIDHIVLTVTDIERSIEFYQRVLGMEPVTFGEGRRALRFGSQKINLHQSGKEYEPKANYPQPGSADLCFVTDGSLAGVIEHIYACGEAIIDGPVARTGALGPMQSIYLRDPDGNLLEVAAYGDGD